MAANKAVKRANDTRVLMVDRISGAKPFLPPRYCARAERPVLAASETINRNPSAPTRPRLVARPRIIEKNGSSGALVFQVAFKAACISPNTPEAVTSSITMPKIVANIPVCGSLDLASIDLTNSPLCCPRNSNNFLDEAIADQVLSKGNARDGYHDQKDRGQRSDGVKRHCAAQGAIG